MMDESAYPTTRDLFTFSSFEDLKTKLKARNAFENICSEARQFIGCFTGELQRASAKCREEFASQQWSLEYFNKTSTLVDLACTPQNIQIAKDSVDCVLEQRVLSELSLCSLKDPKKDCSQAGSSPGQAVDWEAVEECNMAK
jgi:hypothetical protein